MGGSSSSSSTSATTQKDNRVVLEGSGLVATDGSTINFETLDGAMVEAALGAIVATTDRSLDSVDLGTKTNAQTVDNVLRFAQDVNAHALRRVDDAQNLVARDAEARRASDAEKLIESYASGNNRTLLIVAAAAGLALITLRK